MRTVTETDRLLIRDWSIEDADAALQIFGSAEVSRWLTPAMTKISDTETMRAVLCAWRDSQPDLVKPAGRWAIVDKRTNGVVGGLSIRLLPPYEEDLELGCQLAPAAWGQGYATEASHALMHWAFRVGAVDELYAVARPGNQRAVAAAERLGMEWVGETDKYYDLTLQVYRLRASELDVTGLLSPDLSVQAVRAAALRIESGSSAAGHAHQDGTSSAQSSD
jgi:RimJ/RimL family protein N-acetyltransferase